MSLMSDSKTNKYFNLRTVNLSFYCVFILQVCNNGYTDIE